MSVPEAESIPWESYGFVPDGTKTGEGARPSDLLSLGLLLSYILIANLAGRFLLPTPKTQAQRTARRIYIWHVFDVCIHIIHEGLFLYHCYFVYGPVLPERESPAGLPGKGAPKSVGGHHWNAPGVYMFNRPDRVYGAHRGNSIVARMWMDYAKADWRWAGTDLSVISIETLMCLVVGPLGIWACEIVRKNKGMISRRAAFWMVVIAACESFGNWAVLIPEIVTGFPNINTHDPTTFWVHFVFMNSIWVGVPLVVLYYCYRLLTTKPDPSSGAPMLTTSAAIIGAESGMDPKKSN